MWGLGIELRLPDCQSINVTTTPALNCFAKYIALIMNAQYHTVGKQQFAVSRILPLKLFELLLI